MQRELKRICSLPVHYWVLFALPPLLFLLYAFIYTARQATDIPVALYDEDHSGVSRQLSFLLEQTEAVHFTRAVNSEEELRQAILRNEVMGAVYFPAGLEKNVKSRLPASVTLYTNASYLVPAKLIYKDAASVLITGGAAVIMQKLQKQGMPSGKAMALVQPIVLTTYSLYNPDYNYQQYLAPGLITVAMQMMMIMATVLLLNYERKTGTLEALVQTARGKAATVIAGKTAAHLLVAWINFILITGIIFPLFHLERPGTSAGFFVLYTLLSLSCIGLGLMISAICRDAMFATDVGLFYTSPAFVFSGYTFPQWAMPWYDQFYAHIMPYSWFLEGFIKVYSMGLPLAYARQEMAALLVFIIIAYPAAILIFQRQCNKIMKL
jgi:ABC-2 type transport system permease protein